MAITNAFVQSQWNEIKRELKKGVKETSKLALREYAKEALRDIDTQSSYDSDTGNLDESLMAGVYEAGKLTDTVHLFRRAEDMYRARTDIHINTRWGGSIDIQKGNYYEGRRESLKALHQYESMLKNTYPEDMSLVIVAEMFYRYFLEDKNGRNWIAGFANYEQSQTKEYARMYRTWYHNMKKINWGKNVKIQK